MTRKQLVSVLDRVLGGSTIDRVLREVRSCMVRTREPRSHPRRLASQPIHDFIDALTRRKTTEAMLQRVRSAAGKANRLR